MTNRLFGVVMAWTIFTTVFAWIPLVRIFAQSEEYQWALGGLKGVGTEGPFWVFGFLALYAFAMLFSGWRGPKRLFYILLPLWHLALTCFLVLSSMRYGVSATWQGQGLGFEIPIPIISIPAVLFTGLAIAWVVLDYREHPPPQRYSWAPANTQKLIAAIVLLAVATVLFRLGTNYNWITALAIVVTVVQWILIVEAFQPDTGSQKSDPEHARSKI